jgi:hypothetical protein
MTEQEEQAVRAVLAVRQDLARVRRALEQVQCVSADGDVEVREALDRCIGDLAALAAGEAYREAVALERLRAVANGGAA